MSTKFKRVYTAFISMLAAGFIISAMGFPLTVLADPAPRPASIQRSRANTSDTSFSFPLRHAGSTWATSGRPKEDASSVYVRIRKIEMRSCRLYVDGWTGRTWKNETVYGYARARQVGKWRIRSNVYEMYGNTNARLTAWANDGTGVISGEWSPDSWGTYTAINGDY
ncbi:hypothetical protein K6V98_05935 [Collinsella sp. AGMB00827]|uniref:Uncharacterized protein n=1 Tax=Collinsella ureilytica TaxID=2869515 RepID=A0ABS7MKJ8_9ACTN|nr:hypothetical protein [Collinsella urealyticum]MBY4797889.1 hypothetical protein [Collinsella urealyticum]